MSDSNKTNNYPELDFMRTLIDNIDSAILSILAHRAQVVNIIMEYKTIHNISLPKSQTRQDTIVLLLEFSEGLQLRKGFVNELLEYLFEKSLHFLNSTLHPELYTLFLQNDDLLLELNRTLKHLDMSFCTLLSERMQLVRQIGVFKKLHNIELLANARWEEVLRTKSSMAEALNINSEAIRGFYNLIHKEALKIESAQAGYSKI